MILQERYELAYTAVCGDLKKPMSVKQIPFFLENLFPSFPYRFSTYNISETLLYFGREGQKTKHLFWSDFRKGLREHQGDSKGFARFTFTNLTFNPECEFARVWQSVELFIALYHFLLVPIRICFEPWKSMLDVRALSSDLAIDGLTFINLLIHANTAYINSKATWVTDRYKILRRLHPSFSIPAIPFDWYPFVLTLVLDLL